jgi:hypothetical protein
VRSVRLLDLVAQSTSAAPRLPGARAFPGAHHFADAVRSCAPRLVLADDLTQCTRQLAYAEGKRLSGYLDLIHVPSQLWRKWLEATRQATPREIPVDASIECSNVRIAADPAGRAGTLRTFWPAQTEQV